MILVDTHVVVWLAFDPGQLSPKAIAAIDSARKKEGGLAISDITLLELATLVKKGRIAWPLVWNLSCRKWSPDSLSCRSPLGHA